MKLIPLNLRKGDGHELRHIKTVGPITLVDDLS